MSVYLGRARHRVGHDMSLSLLHRRFRYCYYPLLWGAPAIGGLAGLPLRVHTSKLPFPAMFALETFLRCR